MTEPKLQSFCDKVFKFYELSWGVLTGRVIVADAVPTVFLLHPFPKTQHSDSLHLLCGLSVPCVPRVTFDCLHPSCRFGHCCLLHETKVGMFGFMVISVTDW